ncbi:hypothetical protein C496_23106 [Natronorubrum tibetense GA33]|uniref:Uncharacterized protein n=1 Tax=Natronorubrum tibetense GA33 TaxID=1114856 RepID=L9VER6_9EURY|nr:hypothetical protein C496_23106 [Natronorubrum tibetense GA33]
MSDEQMIDSLNGSALQEAIDAVVQILDHPSDLSISYSFDGETKRTRFRIQEPESKCYELVYEGQNDENEPIIRRIE